MEKYKKLEQSKDLYKFYRKHMTELFNDLEPIYGYCISLDLATGKIKGMNNGYLDNTY